MLRKLGWRWQRTLRDTATVEGVGYITGQKVRLRIRPTEADTGILFQRVDLPSAPLVPARIENVTGANRRTIIGNAPIHVELIEHVMAALGGMRIDNVIIEVNGAEPPGLDGSAEGFVKAMLDAGVVQQDATKDVYGVDQTITVTDGRGTLSIHSDEEDCLRVSYLLDYGMHGPLERQRHTHLISPEHFLHDLANCRTFILAAEAETLRKQGIGINHTWEDLLVFGDNGPLGNNRVRFADEPARHKVLDIVGDMNLFGYDLRGHIVGYRSGHALNAMLVRRLTQELYTENSQTEPAHTIETRKLLRVA